jgi:hypothetical protein
MLQIREAVGVSGAQTARIRMKHPVLSTRWLKTALVAHRVAFEQEMRRERRQFLDRRFDTFWKEMSARQA